MVVSGGAAADAIDDSDDYEGTRVENGKTPPFLADVDQNSALAGLAIVAQSILIVAPGGAVAVRHRRPCFRDYPECGVLELEPAVGRWLATARLQNNSNWFRQDWWSSENSIYHSQIRWIMNNRGEAKA